MTAIRFPEAPALLDPLCPSARLRVLFVVPYVPSRIRVRPYHLLLGLAERGHAVTLVCPVSGPAEARDLEALRPACARVVAVPERRLAALPRYLRALPGNLPLQAAHSLSPRFVAAVADELRRGDHDVAHVEHLRAAEVARRAIVAAGTSAPPVVFDSVDSISLLFERALRTSPSLKTRALSLLDLARTRRYEAACQHAFQQILVTSPEDRWALRTLGAQLGPGADTPITVVPNGVDLSYFTPSDAPRDPATLVFSGKMSYHANHAAALFLLREIMPLIWRARPEVRVQIVGAAPAQSLIALGADQRVEVTGYVPDLRPYLARATVAVCPIRYGVGIQNKVLEAMAMRAPVVASRQSVVALTARQGQDLLAAEGAEPFADAVLALLEDETRRAALGAAGRQYVERCHTWSGSVADLEASYGVARAYNAAA